MALEFNQEEPSAYLSKRLAHCKRETMAKEWRLVALDGNDGDDERIARH